MLNEQMRPVFFTQNGNVSGTTRILCAWIEVLLEQGASPALVCSWEGELLEWARELGIPCLSLGNKDVSQISNTSLLLAVSKVVSWCFMNRLKPTHMHSNEHGMYRICAMASLPFKAYRSVHVRYLINQNYSRWAFGGRLNPDGLAWTSQFQMDACGNSICGIVESTRQHLIPLGYYPDRFQSAEETRAAVRNAWRIKDNEFVVGVTANLAPR